MRLKSLKLAGFKSFANTTTFTFAHGITAIVGPNGCGKSNVIDAIRWVLGETSAKQLRGGAMSDVIFAGTQEKSAKSVASVELTFEHTQDEQTGIRHEFNLYHELSVRRQINMEGRSDYFINGTRCRRRDVIDVFLGTGLSARSYAVIEQGMIGRIVESNPMQLREFIEEAAGVSRYQARRLETQKNLEKTQENLTRLYDIQSELERQKKILSKQAASAQQHNELSETLLDIKQQLAIQQLYQAKHTQQQQKSSHEQSAKITAALQADYESLKAKHDKLTAHINHEQWLKDDAQSAHYQQQLGLQQAEQQLNAALTQVTINEQNLIGFDAQRQQLMDEQARLTVKLQAQHHELAVLHPKLSELALRRDAHKQEELPLQRTWQQVQDRQLQLQEQERKLEQQLATNTQSLHHLKLNQNRWDIKQQHWQQIQQPDADSDNSLATQITALNKQIQQTARQQDSVASVIETLQPQWQALQQQVTEQQRRLTDYEKSQALLVGEYDTLHKIVHPKPIKAVQQGNLKINDNTDNEDNIAKPIVITLREQIELTAQGQQYAQLLDSVLTLWLESHVLVDHKSEKSASKLADSLWSALESHSSTLVTYSSNTSQQDKQHPSHSLWLPAKLKGNHDSFIQALPDDYVDKILPLSQLIAQPTLALWQQCYLYLPALEISAVKTNKALSAILKVLPPSALLLTTDGWIMSSLGTINLAKFINAHNAQHDNKGDDQFLSQRLSQRTRLSELTLQLDDFDNQIETQQQTIKRTQVDYDALLINLEEARAQAERLSQDNYRYHKQLTTQQGAYERQQADRQRLDADKVSLMAEQQELEQQSEALTIAQQHIKNDISSLTPELKATSTKRQQLQDRRNEFNRNRQLNDKAWQSLQLTMQKAEMSLEHSTDNLARVHAVYEQAVQSELAVQKRLETHKEQLPHLQASLHTAQTARDEQQALLIERENALTALKQDYSLQQSELEALQMKWQSQQSVVASQATQLALSTAQLQDIIHHTQDALDRYYLMIHKSNPQHSPSTVSVSSVLTDFITHERRVRPDRISELKSQCDDIQEQLSRIGAVNLAAVSELAELDKRLAPLTQQTADIAASIETLTEAISAIDETTKTLFLQTLDNVNRELAELFAKVFGGGHASLTLDISSMPDNTSKSEQWRAGLTLMAQPKGKRNSRLAVLSGGEKTLTALSLIFAIFKQHPAPFCVLDEVDAPLDDANVARFTSLIHELAANLQFIFISHNKLAMQIADELKGITMPSAGISTLVNVSLAEAAQYIDS